MKEGKYMSEAQKFRIKFELTDEFGNDYINESRVDICCEIGEREIDVIGEQLNVFLKQCGYIRKNDLIFMEDITEEEYDALSEYLNELRNKKESDANDD